jgi:hypothetical protein
LYSRTKRLFIPEHYSASKSFAAVREAFSNAYPDKKVLNKETIHRLVTKFWDTGSVCDRKHVRHRTVLTQRNVEETLARLPQKTVPEKWIIFDMCSSSIVGRGLWPPRSPDLTLPDFFLWGFLKERVYSNNPRSME